MPSPTNSRPTQPAPTPVTKTACPTPAGPPHPGLADVLDKLRSVLEGVARANGGAGRRPVGGAGAAGGWGATTAGTTAFAARAALSPIRGFVNQLKATVDATAKSFAASMARATKG